MSINDLVNNPVYELHHTAAKKGYISRKSDGIVKEYSGRFGTGYTVERPRWDTTKYIYIDYYIRVN